MNGAPLTERFKQRSAYVAQEELFMPTLNAWETLQFQAVLRNRVGLTHAKLQERMHDVMAVMGLSRVKNTQVCALRELHSTSQALCRRGAALTREESAPYYGLQRPWCTYTAMHDDTALILACWESSAVLTCLSRVDEQVDECTHMACL